MWIVILSAADKNKTDKERGKEGFFTEEVRRAVSCCLTNHTLVFPQSPSGSDLINLCHSSSKAQWPAVKW